MDSLKKKIVFLLVPLLILSAVVNLNSAQAYKTHTTHPALTEQIVDFYNVSYGDQISSLEKDQIIRGSIDEDTPPRWLNHFYDPTSGDGWRAENLGVIPPGLLQIFSKVFLNANTEIVSSKKWAHSELLQTKYVSYGGNNTWENGVRAYAEGDTNKAYYILGHILHLLEDATVPDHTRGDTHVHPGSGLTQDHGSPYEDYADQFNQGTLKMVPSLVKAKKQPVIFKTLDEYFERLATYSNNYFFSEDTINSKKYSKPKIIKEDEFGYGYGTDENLKEFPIIKIFEFPDLKTGEIVKNYTLKDDKRFILKEYFSRLSEAAVLNGAGVIKLFKEEGENAKKNPALLSPIPTVVPGNKMYSLGFGYILPAITFLQNTFNSLFATAAPSAQTQKSGELMSGPTLPVVEPAPTDIPPAEVPKIVKPKAVETVPTLPPKAVLGLKIEDPVKPIPQAPAAATIPNIKSVVSPNAGSSAAGKSTAGSESETVEVIQDVPEVIITTTTNDIPVSTSTLAVTTTVVTATTTVVVSTTIPVDTSALEATTTTSTVTQPPPADLNPPSIPGIILKSSVNNTSLINITVTSTDADSSGIYFDIAYSISTTTEKVWQELAVGTTSTMYAIEGQRGVKYFIRARASDVVGNTSIWSESASLIVPYTQEVVINEIAWAGTSGDTKNDQWIELYNTTDAAIDLSSWKLFIDAKAVDIVFKNKIIAPHGYYLLERSNDNVVREISADALYFYAAGLSGTGNRIDLVKNNSEMSDQVDAALGWFAGDVQKYRTMERLRTDYIGNDANNWQSNQGSRGVGRTNNGGEIMGSPRQTNFGFLMLAGRQEETNRLLTKNNSPYILGFYEVPAGSTLTIEPGVVIKSGFKTSVINVFGSLSSQGAVADPVVFTSGRDHSFDSSVLNVQVGTGWSAPDPASKDWQGFWFHPGSMGNVNATEIRYAGRDFRVDNFIYRSFVSEAIRAENALLTIDGSNFFASGGTDIYSYMSTTTIQNTIFISGSQLADSANTAVEAESSTLNLTGVTFKGYGNPAGPVWVKFTWPTLADLVFIDNALDRVFLDRTETGMDRVLSKSLPVLTNGLTVSASTTLTIDPGVTVLLPDYAAVQVQGSLQAVGTSEEPIIFTAAPGSTYWDTINFDHSTSALEYVVMTKGNRLSGGMICAKASNLSIGRSTFLDSRAPGATFDFQDTVFTAKNSIIGFTDRPAFNRLVGVRATGGELHLDQVTFKNLTIGIEGAGDPLPILRLNGMNEDYFPNVDLAWSPAVWVGSDGNTISVGDPNAGQTP